MPKAKKIHRKRVIKAIEGSYGIILAIAEKLGVNRQKLSEFLHKKENEDILELVRVESDRILDIAESKLFKKISQEDPKMIKFFLSTKGKNRGYTMKQEIEHSGETAAPVNINIIKEEK